MTQKKSQKAKSKQNDSTVTYRNKREEQAKLATFFFRGED